LHLATDTFSFGIASLLLTKEILTNSELRDKLAIVGGKVRTAK